MARSAMYRHISPSDSISPKSLKSGEACLICRSLKRECDGMRPSCGPCQHSPEDDSCEYGDDPGRSRTRAPEDTVSGPEAQMRDAEDEHPEETRPATEVGTTASFNPIPSSILNPPSPPYADRRLRVATDGSALQGLNREYIAHRDMHTTTSHDSSSTTDSYNSTSSITSSSHNIYNSHNTTFNYTFTSPLSSDRDSRTSLRNHILRSSNDFENTRWSITRFPHVGFQHYLPMMFYPIVWVPYYVPWMPTVSSTPGIAPHTDIELRQSAEPQGVVSFAEESDATSDH